MVKYLSQAFTNTPCCVMNYPFFCTNRPFIFCRKLQGHRTQCVRLAANCRGIAHSV